MTKKKNEKKEKLTDNITYLIEDSTIYLLLNNNRITKEELNIVYKKIPLVIEDNELSYINISGKNLEENKKFFIELGFTLSYYDVNKLNTLYRGIKDKKDYKCYGIMTKKDFYDKIEENQKENIKKTGAEIKIIDSNSGFISNMILLFGGIILLCYFCIEGAILLIKWEEQIYGIR